MEELMCHTCILDVGTTFISGSNETADEFFLISVGFVYVWDQRGENRQKVFVAYARPRYQQHMSTRVQDSLRFSTLLSLLEDAVRTSHRLHTHREKKSNLVKTNCKSAVCV